MKYRILNSDERSHFDEAFKQFLIVNGVSNEDWLQMVNTSSDKAQKLVEIFSDEVLEKVYSNIQYLEFRSKNTCIVFKLEAAHISLIAISSNNENIDLSSADAIHQAFIHNAKDLSHFKSKKAYDTDRNQEVHKMLEEGCIPSAKEFWEAVQEVVN